MRAIHWFRSDLRFDDNQALDVAADHADELGLLFCLDPRFYKRDEQTPRIAFLNDALTALAGAAAERGLSLWILRGAPEDRLPRLATELGVTLVTWNRDYSPVAKQRDRDVMKALTAAGIGYRHTKDRVVFESHEVLTKSGDGFKVYTPYRNAWWRAYEACDLGIVQRTRWPKPIAASVPSEEPAAVDLKMTLPKASEQSARARFETFLENGAFEYEQQRDIPAVDGTSRLSPYFRFGMLSIRRVIRDARAEMDRAGESMGFRKWLDELVWREFYHAILDRYPGVMSGAFRSEYNALEWDNNPEHFAAWCEGRTGFPFVDAGMRQLNATGWMHNRVRMVVASFLTKDLLIDWRWGERYFMSRLVDGDPASNNGGWQWAASTGTDAQPYFRIFNPTAQGERFDPEGEYIRRWVPALERLRAKAVHRPETSTSLAPGYPAPIVDHRERRTMALARYKAVRD
ncbi:MAG: deoxyribodipyrimidine photo-lyase [Pseudomonadota bacterium]